MSKLEQQKANGLRKFERTFGKEKPVPKPVRLDKAKKAIEDVANSTSPKSPSPKQKPDTPSPKTAYARNARWREKNRERYNEGQKDIMRRKAASAKDKGDV